MHFNENSERVAIVNKDNTVRFGISFPKSKRGDYTVRQIKAEPTYGKFSSVIPLSICIIPLINVISVSLSYDMIFTYLVNTL